jgi:ABC-type nitrate/sulfonate/bicarbonate transport system permease component
MRRTTGTLVQLWLIVPIIAVWELTTRQIGSYFFPPPSVIVVRVYELWFSGPVTSVFLTDAAFADLVPGMGRMLAGWILASLAGIALGFALGRLSGLQDYLDPLLEFGRSIPPPTLLPLFLVLFKIGTEMQVATIVFGVIWPVLLNSIDGARYVDRLYLDTARVFTLTRTQRLFLVILPAAAPKIFAGLRLSLSISLILMVISELVASTNGIGFSLIYARQNFDMPGMWAAIVLLGVLGLILNASLVSAERRLLSWHHRERQTT